jgi:hypothetical protein
MFHVEQRRTRRPGWSDLNRDADRLDQLPGRPAALPAEEQARDWWLVLCRGTPRTTTGGRSTCDFLADIGPGEAGADHDPTSPFGPTIRL